MDLTVLGILEFSSIAVGIKSLDAMVKASPVIIVDAKTICPGKYLVVITGDVASVEYSLNAGRETGTGFLADEMFLPMVHRDVVEAIGKTQDTGDWDSIGIIETYSVVSSIEAADVAAKTGGVRIVEIRLSMGLGGKSYVKMMGDLYSVEAAMKAGTVKAERKGLLCSDIIIPKPHEDIKKYFI